MCVYNSCISAWLPLQVRILSLYTGLQKTNLCMKWKERFNLPQELHGFNYYIVLIIYCNYIIVIHPQNYLITKQMHVKCSIYDKYESSFYNSVAKSVFLIIQFASYSKVHKDFSSLYYWFLIFLFKLFFPSGQILSQAFMNVTFWI